MVTLRSEWQGTDVRNLWAYLTEEGGVQFVGQDLGPSVRRFFGGQNEEYEWIITVRAPDVPALIRALGGGEDAEVLALLAEQFSGGRGAALQPFLQDHGIPSEFWNRVGD